MAERVCPVWIGYLMLSPLRRLLENPRKMLGPFVSEGMTVLEPGPGMGYFTLALARMVGQGGRVVAVELQPKMLAALERRARRAGLLERIDLRLAGSAGLGIQDLAGQVDFGAAIHVVHEVPDQAAFFAEVFLALKPGGELLVIEPKGHVRPEQLEQTVAAAERAGFAPGDPPGRLRGPVALLRRPGLR